MSPRKTSAAAGLSLVILACGRTAVAPPPPRPTPTVVSGFTVTAVVFEDEDGDGEQGPADTAVVPFAEIEIGGRVGTSAPGTGAVILDGVPAGRYDVHFQKLPPFYLPGVTQTITVPQEAAPLLVPAVLPISGNHHGLYLSDGDSISEGYGSSDGLGFRGLLESKLQGALVRASVTYRGARGGRTDEALSRIGKDLDETLPAVTLLDWGTNDWNPDLNIPGSEVCQSDPSPPACPMIPNLGAMIDAVRAAQSFPAIATLLPPDPSGDDPPQRRDWVLKANELIRQLAKDKQALLLDVGDAFVKKGPPSSLYYDHIHPNDDGYALMADTIFQALTQGSAGSSSPLSAASALGADRTGGRDQAPFAVENLPQNGPWSALRRSSGAPAAADQSSGVVPR